MAIANEKEWCTDQAVHRPRRVFFQGLEQSKVRPNRFPEA